MSPTSGTWLASSGAVAALFALAIATLNSADVVLLNHSPSIPEGFYLRTSEEVEPGAVVTVRARDVAPQAARERHYDGEADRFIKRVAAVAGQRVCGDGETVTVDGRVAARAFRNSERSAPPGWVGCRTLGSNEVLLLGDSPDSFDGRYWGPVSTHFIEGVWRPL